MMMLIAQKQLEKLKLQIAQQTEVMRDTTTVTTISTISSLLSHIASQLCSISSHNAQHRQMIVQFSARRYGYSDDDDDRDDGDEYDYSYDDEYYYVANALS
jgi:hypothetical protein